MKIIKVNDHGTRKKFLDTARIIYRDDHTWVCPLDRDIEAVFDRNINPYFSHGEVERWIAEDANGNLSGRIAAFINRKLVWAYDQPTGGIGFFECINDQSAANMLFDTARGWLLQRGMEAMDGPINFGETDRYWGLLVEGFTHPSFDVPYNHQYYKGLFEAYGFRKYYGMEGFHVSIPEELPERFRKIAEWVEAKPGYEYRHFNWEEKDSIVRDFAKAFNEAWSNFKIDFKPLTTEYIDGVLNKAKSILDEELIWVAYHEGEPIGTLLVFPDLNQILKHLNGKLNLYSRIKFLYLRKKKTMTRLKGLLMGVVPKYQGLGIESVLFLQLFKKLQKKPWYREIELTWVADFNPKMRRTFVSTGGYPAKKYITYRYLFDRNKEFKRYPIPDFPAEKGNNNI
jgi:GNAT superfamily N-acetyltransferase